MAFHINAATRQSMWAHTSTAANHVGLRHQSPMQLSEKLGERKTNSNQYNSSPHERPVRPLQRVRSAIGGPANPFASALRGEGSGEEMFFIVNNGPPERYSQCRDTFRASHASSSKEKPLHLQGESVFHFTLIRTPRAAGVHLVSRKPRLKLSRDSGAFEDEAPRPHNGPLAI